MPKRTTSPLTNAERRRRFMAKHPEKKEEYRLHMKQLRAARRQRDALKRLALITPTDEDDSPEVLAAIAQLVKPRKIVTGLTKEENPIKADMATLLQTTQGSKV